MRIPADSDDRGTAHAKQRIGGQGRTRSITWPKAVAFSLLPVLILLLVAEGGLRVYSWYFRTAYERYNASTGRLELVPGLQTTLSDGRKIRINSKGFIGRVINSTRMFRSRSTSTIADTFPSYVAGTKASNT
jgi:hypothetical protein